MRRSVPSLLIVVLLAGCAGSPAHTSSVGSSASHSEHGGIRILSDADLDAAHGVVGGSGTAADPFVISGWEIHAVGGATGIHVSAVRKHLVIQDCHIVTDKASKGIRIAGSKNVKVSASVLLVDDTVASQSIGATTTATVATSTSPSDTVETTATTAPSSATELPGTTTSAADPDLSSTTDQVTEDLLVLVESSENITLVENHLDDGRVVIASTNVTLVADNSFTQSDDDGVSAATGVFADTPHPILEIIDGSDHSVTGNVVGAEDLAGISIVGSTNASVSDNAVAAGGGAALAVVDTSDVAIVNNTVTGVRGAPESALIVVDDASDVQVIDNIVADSNGAGIVAAGVSNATIADNAVAGNSGNGIEVSDSDNVTIVSTNVTRNDGHGIVVEDSENITVASSNVTGSGRDGIQFDNVTDGNITQNEVTTSQGYGVAVDGEDIEVTNNTVAENGGGGSGGGILVQGVTNVVAANELVDNQGYGVALAPGAEDVNITGNSLSGDDDADAILVPQEGTNTVQGNDGDVVAEPPGFDPRALPGRAKWTGFALATGALLGVAAFVFYRMRRGR